LYFHYLFMPPRVYSLKGFVNTLTIPGRKTQMTRLQLVTIICIFIFAGCAPKTFTHPSKNEEDFNRDRYDCQQVAAKYAESWGVPGNPFTIAEQINECMTQKYGWTRK
jgi:hypothetical protein